MNERRKKEEKKKELKQAIISENVKTSKKYDQMIEAISAIHFWEKLPKVFYIQSL